MAIIQMERQMIFNIFPNYTSTNFIYFKYQGDKNDKDDKEVVKPDEKRFDCSSYDQDLVDMLGNNRL